MAGVYALVFGSWVIAALVLAKPKIARRGFIAGALAAYPLTFVLTQIGFFVGDLVGLVSYPLDASPYFFVSWFVVVWTLATLTAATAAWIRLQWRAQDDASPRPEAK